MDDFRRLLRDLVKYRDHCYCNEDFEVVDLLDRARDKLEELQGYVIDDEDHGEPEVFDEATGLRIEDTF